MIWMEPLSKPRVSPHKAPYSRPASLQRVTVYELFQNYLPLLSELPGERSQFNQTDIGYEWGCDLALGVAPAAISRVEKENKLYLHFSLVDLPGQWHPAAVLYLLEQCQEPDDHERILLPLEDLSETHDQLNAELARLEVNIEIFEKANDFILALIRVRESLSSEVTWA
jgi:hypothetical protein